MQPSKLIVYAEDTQAQPLGALVIPTLESCVCPYCKSKNYDELTENPPETGNVYVYDLTSGAQTKLDELLSQGYKVAARYSKQYILEKPKEVKA